MLLNKEQVLAFLPHRDPFLFIDCVESISLDGVQWDGTSKYLAKELLGAEAVAHFNVDQSMPILAGHFPNNPVLPGVVQVEMMAQCSCFLLYPTVDRPGELEIDVALVKVAEAKFRRPVIPVAPLKIVAMATKVRGSMLESVCKLFSNDILMSEVTLLASFQIKN